MGQKPKSKRERVSLYEFMERFDTEEKAMAYLEERRWHGQRSCPHCGSVETSVSSHKKMPYWCKGCRKYFSVRTGTLMEGSHIKYRKWMMAVYLMSTFLKGVSSTKLGNDIGVQQKSAWFLAHRIRQGWVNNASQFFGQVVEIDEAYLGGLERNKHKDKKTKKGRGPVGKEAVIAVKDRKDKKVKALRVESTDAQTLHWIIIDTVAKGTTVCTDEHRSYSGIEKHGFKHETVYHSIGEYVRGEAHTNGVESFWALLKRRYYGIYHRMSAKHLQKYIDEFSNCINVRQLDMMDQINATIAGLIGTKRISYREVVSQL